ncbi:MAG: hypothetical protein OXM87_06000 [Truepera sp.]|nr:hypothetical protein [Truepera sp.]
MERNFLSAKTMGTGAPLPAQEAEWVENSWRAEQVDEDGAATIRRAA